jgi:hypothetical protein
MSLLRDPTFLFALLCIVIMVVKKLVSGEVEKVTHGFFFNPYVLGTLIVGVLVWGWVAKGKQVPLSLYDQWTANW